MQKLFRLIVKCGLVISLLITSSCDRFPSDPDLADPQDALYVLIQAHALKQLWMYHYFETFSNGYEEGQLFVYEPTLAELEALHEELRNVLLHKEDVISAAQTVTDSLGLTPSPLSKTTGIFGSLFSFFSEGAAMGERSRERILTIVSNMSNEEKSALFNNQLRSKWKNQFYDENDFWTKLQNGDLDDKTSSIYNDFYDNSDLNNRFVSLADDNNLTPGKIFVKEGASLTEKGMDVVIEATKIATPLGKGMDMVDEGKKWWEKAEKAVDKPLELIEDEIKERVAGKLAGMVDIDGAVNATGLGEKTATAVKILSDISFGTDDTQELYEKAIDWGVAKITSPDKSITPDVIVAENKSGGGGLPDLIFGVGNYVNHAGEILMALPAGNWDISAMDKKGEKAATPSVTITSQQETAVDIQMTGSLHQDVKTRLEKANFISVYFQYGDNTGQYMGMQSSSDYPLSSSGTSFSVAYDYVNDEGTHYILNISGHTTILGYDLPAVTLHATKSIRQANKGWGQYSHQEEEISIDNLPFAYFSGATGTYFEIGDYYNSEYLASLSSIVNFSDRTAFYNSDDDVLSDTTFSSILNSSQARLRVTFMNSSTP
jgi:hypothetical protein